MLAHGNAPLQLFLVVWIFLRSLDVICYDRWVPRKGHTKTSRIRVSWTPSVPFYFNLFKLDELWSYYQKHVNQIILNHPILYRLALRIFEAFVRIVLIVNSFLESNSPDILPLCETPLDDWIDFGNFSARGYLPLIRKDSSTHMHCLAVFLKEGLPFAQHLSLDLRFWVAFLHSMSYFFFLYRSPSSSLCTVFDSVSSKIYMRFSRSTHQLMFFVFGDFIIHHKDWLTYSGGTDRPGELCYKFPISNDLTHIVNFPTWIPGCDSRSPALLDLSLSFWRWYLFYNGFLSIGKFWSCYCLSFHWLSI